MENSNISNHILPWVVEMLWSWNPWLIFDNLSWISSSKFFLLFVIPLRYLNVLTCFIFFELQFCFALSSSNIIIFVCYILDFPFYILYTYYILSPLSLWLEGPRFLVGSLLCFWTLPYLLHKLFLRNVCNIVLIL